jgi:hypothetical protein
MSVYIACDKCDKRLKIPEEVVGRPIKCPVCGSVFKATPEKVVPGEEAAVAPVRLAPAAHKEEGVVPIRKKPAVLDDEDEDMPKPRKKTAPAEDEEGIVPAVRKPAAVEDDDEDRPARRRRRVADEDEAEEPAKKGKRRTAWYVMLPLLILSLCGAGLAALWTIGFSYLDMDRGLKHLGNFDTKVWIGVATAGAVTLLCLIFSLIPVRAWLRFLLVLFFLAVGYCGSFAAIHWWNELPFIPDEQKEDPFNKNPPPNGPIGGMPMPPGGGGRGGPMAPGGGRPGGPPQGGQGGGEGQPPP